MWRTSRIAARFRYAAYGLTGASTALIVTNKISFAESSNATETVGEPSEPSLTDEDVSTNTPDTDELDDNLFSRGKRWIRRTAEDQGIIDPDWGEYGEMPIPKSLLSCGCTKVERGKPCWDQLFIWYDCLYRCNRKGLENTCKGCLG
eukprot:870136_1